MKSLFLTIALSLALISAAPAGPSSGVRLFVHHEVADYAAWRKVYDEFDGTRKKMGVTAQAVYQSVDNPNDVVVTHDFKDAATAKAFVDSAELRTAMQKAGVKGPPSIWITKKAVK